MVVKKVWFRACVAISAQWPPVSKIAVLRLFWEFGFHKMAITIPIVRAIIAPTCTDLHVLLLGNTFSLQAAVNDSKIHNTVYKPVRSAASTKRYLWAPVLTINALVMQLTVQVYTPCINRDDTMLVSARNNPKVGNTILDIIKLKTIPVPARFQSGSKKLKMCRYFIIFCDI